jgi:outer membrane receptor protein involved in Fe transport
MKFKFLLFFLSISFFSIAQTTGTISGILKDKNANNQPLAFANIVLKNTSISANTDIDGKYLIKAAPGEYIIVFSFIGYENVEVPVTIIAGQTITINKSIGSGNYTLQDVVIKSTSSNREKETAILLDQKKAVVIKQSIGAQEMSRKGISDVEEGLTKITGITKVDGRGLFVRGLEDRYNNLLINDLAAPTNNPFKKIIPLDLFSTDVVSVIEVYKTFNPNFYGDFAGGTFNIVTSKVSKSITKLNLGFGFTTNNSLEKFLIAEDSDTNSAFFGFNGNNRDLPSVLGIVPSSYKLSAQDAEKSFKSGFNVNKIVSPLNTSVGFLHSEKFNLKDQKSFSYLISVNFDNKYEQKKGPDRDFTFFGKDIGYNNNFETTDYNYKTSLSALVGLNYNSKKLKLNYNTMYIKTTANLIKDQFGLAGNNPNKVLIRTNQLDVSNYLNNQLLAEYSLNENKKQTIKAGFSFANTKYNQPDRKFFSGTKIGENEIITSVAGNNFIRQYLNIAGDTYLSALAEYNIKFGKNENKLTFGYNGNNSQMKSTYRFITPQNISAPNSITVVTNNLDETLNSYLQSDSFNFRESSNSTYQAKLYESANAGYVNLFYKVNEKLEFNGGLRFENTIRETKSRDQGSFDDPFITLKYDNKYFLPAFNVKYGLNEKSNIRFATGKTYSKPVIMESYPIEYVNADGTTIAGNPNLKNSDNYNIDLKYEMFPTDKELFVIGLFGKSIQNPIERTFKANAATSTITTFLNSEKATLFGAEIEFILDFARLNKSLSAFSLGFNTSLMQTKVEVNPFTTVLVNGLISTTESIETHKTRQLQGASNWLINSDLKYQFNLNKNWSNTISLVYSVFGKRIFSVGTVGLDHIYELPVHQLDFVLSSKLSKNLDLKFSADNLLNPYRQFEIGNNSKINFAESSTIRNSFKKGIGFSINLGYTF